MPLALALATALLSSDLDRYVYPLAPAKVCPPISVDTKAAPSLEPWGEEAKNLATAWYPHICQLLATEDYKPLKSINFVFRKDQGAPAYASGNEISFSVEWVTAHPDDLGMVIHELTHLIQAYPRNKVDTGWLVEGIADYIRWWRYEPEAPRSRVNWEKASYRDAYRTTAGWLAWVGKKYNLSLVPKLDRALRKGDDPMPIFKELTGKDADALWGEYRAANEAKSR
ncbi:MAG: hypothetical protein JNJ45_04455 [Chthonomonas sp.]|nr:hypothetical protein [Chthonomonas sp.]